MDRQVKTKAVSNIPIDIGKDIALINQYSKRELSAEEVYAFSVVLCDNDVDRDYEAFTDSALEKLVPLFVGKTGVFNHSWDAKDQVARIYRTYLMEPGGKNALGKPLKQLVASAYIPRGGYTDEIIEKIESGILKEVSVGCSMRQLTCSICGESMRWSGCPNGHRKGKECEGKLCYGVLSEPNDAFEFSFVAVPSQRGAGVTKSFSDEDVEKAFDIVMGIDLAAYPDFTGEIELRLAAGKLDAREKETRAAIIAANKQFLGGK